LDHYFVRQVYVPHTKDGRISEGAIELNQIKKSQWAFEPPRVANQIRSTHLPTTARQDPPAERQTVTAARIRWPDDGGEERRILRHMEVAHDGGRRGTTLWRARRRESGAGRWRERSRPAAHRVALLRRLGQVIKLLFS
jgi:hypothetical protein